MSGSQVGYQIVDSATTIQLSNDVNDRIAAGWFAYGTPVFANKQWHQAMHITTSSGEYSKLLCEVRELRAKLARIEVEAKR